jgi:hypothetical protein
MISWLAMTAIPLIELLAITASAGVDSVVLRVEPLILAAVDSSY